MFQDEQISLDRALARAVIDAVPRGWDTLELRAKVGSVSLVRAGAVAWATADVKRAAEALFALFAKHGHTLVGFTYRFTKDDDGSWSFVGEYDYG